MIAAVVGATGLVGRELLLLLERSKLPITSVHLFASKEHSILFRNEIKTVYPLPTSPPKCDLAFFCTSKEISKFSIPKWIAAGIQVIDLSSAFRCTAPLIIPEINHKRISGPLLCSPNCTTTIMLTALFPLHQEAKIKRIVASTYQAASGGGKKLLQRLHTEIESYPSDKFPTNPYAFNLLMHPDEEPKLELETERILGEKILINSTCVRTPTLRVHGLSLNVTFEKPLLQLPIIDKTCSPYTLAGKPDVVFTKCAIDHTMPNTYSFFILGDQLLKGAALNALQIAEYVYSSVGAAL